MSENEKTIGMCRLCKQTIELQGSHIVPKMFYELIKKNSVTARLRASDNPNVPLQDGLKTPFLCDTCEKKFGEYERKFSKIYRNFAGSFGVAEFDSNSDMFRYFVLSIGWRVLQYLNEKGIGELTNEEHQAIDSKLEQWRLALRDEDHRFIKQQKQYVIPTTRWSYFAKIPTHKISNVGADFQVFGPENRSFSAFSTTQVPYLLFLSMAWGEEKMLADYEVGRKIIPADTELPETLKEQLGKFHNHMFEVLQTKVKPQNEKFLRGRKRVQQTKPAKEVFLQTM